MKMHCPTCGGPHVSIETFDRWTPTGEWERGVQQLRCNNPKQANEAACPVIRMTFSLNVPDPVLSTPDPAPARTEKRKPPKRHMPAKQTPTFNRSKAIVRNCVDCEAPSKPMMPRANAQEEWRCRPCYKTKKQRDYRQKP